MFRTMYHDPTISRHILDLMADGRRRKAGEIITHVHTLLGAEESSVRGELTAMKRRGELWQPKYGYYKITEPREEPEAAPPQAASWQAPAALDPARAGTIEVRAGDVVLFRVRLSGEPVGTYEVELAVARSGAGVSFDAPTAAHAHAQDRRADDGDGGDESSPPMREDVLQDAERRHGGGLDADPFQDRARAESRA